MLMRLQSIEISAGMSQQLRIIETGEILIEHHDPFGNPYWGPFDEGRKPELYLAVAGELERVFLILRDDAERFINQ